MSLLIASAITFAAGLVEGKSVLDHNKKSRSVKYRSPLSSRLLVVEGGSLPGSLVVPTLLYGVLSVPLTVIGASPSLELLSKIATIDPNHPPRSLEIRQEDISTNELKPRRRRMKIDPISGVEAHEESLIENYNENISVNQKQHSNVQQMREENRRALAAAIRDTQSTSRKGLHQHQQFKLSSYFATLDGRALPTPIAETMRRVRIGLGLYGLITVAIAYQLKTPDDKNEGKSERKVGKNYSTGRDPVLIQNFVAGKKTTNNVGGSKSNEGVALRLFNNFDDLKRFSEFNQSPSRSRMVPESGNFVLPIMTCRLDHVDDGDIVFWSLGSTESDWDEFPITTKWLYSDVYRHPYILLESNVCSPLKDYAKGGCHNEKEDILTQRAVFEAKKIKEIAKKNLRETLDESQDLNVFHIIIGNSRRQRSNESEVMDRQNIYIDGHNALARYIIHQIQLIDSFKRKSLEIANEQTENSAMELHQQDDIKISSINSISWQTIDAIGKNIRQSVQILLCRVGSSILSLSSNFRFTQKTPINIFSDDPDIMRWFKKLFTSEKGFELRFHDSKSHSRKTSTHEGEIFIFLCSTDDATIDVALSIMCAQDEPNSSIFLPIIEEEISRETLKLLTKGDLEKCTPICITSVQEELLTSAKKMLIEGKTAKEIEDSLACNKLL